jgi:myo-inositol 2-dehydrogenase/D-chiro-inositol 1-dehydrogenase
LPQTVVAQVSHEALGLEVEDLGIAVFRWESGLIAEIVSSFTFAAADVSVELYGTQGTLLLSGVDLASRDITSDGFMRRYRADQQKRWETLDVVPRFKLGAFHQQNAMAFVDALEQGRPPPITVTDGLNACRLIDAAYRSAQSGTRVRIQ